MSQGREEACPERRKGADRPKEAKTDGKSVQTVLKTNNQGTNQKSVPQSRCHIQARKQTHLTGKEGQVRWAFLSFNYQP